MYLKMGIIKQCTHSHSPPSTPTRPTHPHSPKIFTDSPTLIQNSYPPAPIYPK